MGRIRGALRGGSSPREPMCQTAGTRRLRYGLVDADARTGSDGHHRQVLRVMFGQFDELTRP